MMLVTRSSPQLKITFARNRDPYPNGPRECDHNLTVNKLKACFALSRRCFKIKLFSLVGDWQTDWYSAKNAAGFIERKNIYRKFNLVVYLMLLNIDVHIHIYIMVQWISLNLNEQ